MHRVIICLLAILSCSGALFSQLPEHFPVLTGEDLPGASFSPNRIFAGTALYGYINGGADLYLEYGFNSAVVSEINYRGGNYKTTIYKMDDQEAAFGIFSVSRYKCISTPVIPDYTCQTRYHLQICRGQYYISIINAIGSEEDMDASLEIGKVITGKIEGSEIDFAEFLPGTSKEELQESGFLVRGRLGIVNGLPDLEDYFKGIKGYTAVIIPHDDKMLVSVKFIKPDAYRQFAALHNWDIEEITEAGLVSKSGERVKKISENRILIASEY
jgi:hypothetical protein